MTLWGTVTSLPSAPELESELVDLNVDLGPVESTRITSSLTDGIRGLYQKCQFYDLLLVAGGTRYPAHQVVLASLSTKFRDRLRQIVDEANASQETNSTPAVASETAATVAHDTESQATPALDAQAIVPAAKSRGNPELCLSNITHPEAVPALLDFVYGFGNTYNVSSDEANKDVLRLASEFDLPRLLHIATDKLAEGLTAKNIVDRLATCYEFQRTAMFEAIGDVLMNHPQALLDVSRNDELMKHPSMLQALLTRASHRYMLGPVSDPDEEHSAPASKRRRVEDKAHVVKGGAWVNRR